MLAVATTCWVLVGWVGLLVGVPGGILASVWIGRMEPRQAVRARHEICRDLPLAMDLLAACSSVGRPLQLTLPIVSRAVGGALGHRLDEISGHLMLGADPVAEWRRLSHDRLLGDLGRTLQRSAESGAPLADALARLAEDRRRERRVQTQTRARKVAIQAAGPLAACFLPAFVLVGVVPTIAGSFIRLLG